MATQKWKTPATGSIILSSTDLSALANGAGALSTAAYDNGTNLNQYATFEWNGAIATAPTADKTLDLYAVYAPDGSSYEDQSASRPPAGSLIGSFVLDNTTSAQRKMIHGVMLLPAVMKFLLINNSGYALTGTNTVKIYTFNNEVL